jgi:hypothetical protein
MRFLSYLFSLAMLVSGAFWLWKERPEVRSYVQNYITSGEFHTLEARFSDQEIMARESKTLLKDNKYSFLEPKLEFYPYALFEIKYTKNNNKTAEGLLLWSLDDGELVLDTATWETTHGFEDCISQKADKNDFKILRALSKNRNYSLDRDKLMKEANVESDILDNMLDNCRKKKLIVQKGSTYRLHLNDPKLTNIPETKIDQWLVTKPYSNANCIPKKYSIGEIQKIAELAFDSDFAIRNVSEVYLPVYCITVQNPDNTHLITHFNALNGKRIHNNRLH